MDVRPRFVKSRRGTALLRDSRAATAVEYGLIIALVVITLVTAIISVAEATSGVWNNVSDKVARAH